MNKNLGELCLDTGKYGIPAPAIDFDKNKFRYLRISDISDDGVLLNNDIKSVDDIHADSYLLSKNDIVFARTGNSTGRTLFYEEKYGCLVYAGFLIKFKIDENKINPKFIKYYTISKQYKRWVVNYQDGSTRGNMNAQSFLELPVPMLAREKQDALVELLDCLTNKIELNNKINEELEKLAKTLYDYWFVQFDFPDENGKPYKSSGGKMVWNDELKREIPEGWEVKCIEEIEPNIITGKTPSTKDDTNFNGDIPFITIGDIRGNMYVVKTAQTLSEKGANSQAKKYIPKDAICVTCIASPGLVGFATKESQTNQQINSVICKQEYNKIYLYFAIKDYFVFSSGAKTGNTFDNMNKGDFAGIKLIYPQKEILEKFTNKISAACMKIKNNSIENDDLSSLRDYLLPMLMNGQVTVKSPDIK